MQTDIHILDVQTIFHKEKARTPIKFGGAVVDSATLFEAQITVENRRGEVGVGGGSMFLSDFWAFPSAVVPHDVRERAMVELARRCGRLLADYAGCGHPIDIVREVEPEFIRLAADLSTEWQLAEPLPILATLVSVSPLDAALHDAFGLANNIDTYNGYGPEFMAHDLSSYFGSAFEGAYPEQFLRPQYVPQIPIFHLVGGLDKLSRSELDDSDPQDGLPNCLEDWVERDGVYCFKVKLRGNDLDWDVERTLAVSRVAAAALAKQGCDAYYLSADTNEICDSPEYMITMMRRIQEASPSTFERILYVEQPTQRDLRAYPHDMTKLAKIVPVLADESLYSDELFDLSLEMGWSGPALKVCKGQSQAVLWAAKAKALDKPYAIQDLTNPGLALLQSVGFAARTYPMMGVEYNSRQYFPSASADVRKAHPEVFTVRGGQVSTASLRGPGLGFRAGEFRRA